MVTSITPRTSLRVVLLAAAAVAGCADDTASSTGSGGGATSAVGTSSTTTSTSPSATTGTSASSAGGDGAGGSGPSGTGGDGTGAATGTGGAGGDGSGAGGTGGAGGEGTGGAGTGGSGAGGSGAGGAGGGGGQLPTCVEDEAVSIVDGLQIATVAEGDPLVEPVGLMFGLDGELYVGNSHSWLASQSTEPAEIFHVADDGELTLLVGDDRMRGTVWAAFGPGGDPAGPGIAYMGTEDVKEGGLQLVDWILTYDGEEVVEGPDSYENGKLLFGPGGAWGTDLYVTGRELPIGDVPGPYSLLTWDLDGGSALEPLDVVDVDTGLRLAVAYFTFGRGGDLGEDLYVGTYDDGVLTPSQEVGIWRVDETLQATRIADELLSSDLVSSPDPDGPWGDALYGSTLDGRILRIGADGEVTELVSGLAAAGGLLFDGDEALLVTEITGRRIRRITPCAPPGG